MIKFSFVFLVLAVGVSVQGAPLAPYDDIVNAAAKGQWDQVQSLITKNFATQEVWKDLSLGSVKELKPVDGGHVYGESEYTFHSASDINGQKDEKSGGHKIINDDGKVVEFDFKPTLGQEDHLKKFGFKPVAQS